MPVDKEKIAELAKKVFSRKVGFNPDSAAARQMSEDTRRNDAVAQKILENSAREEQARNLQDVYTGKRIPSETPLKSDDWKLALALTGLKGLASGVASGFSLPVNNGVARAFNTWGKYAMPSALLDNIGLSSISPIADAAVSSYWTSGLLKNISDASGNGGPSALAAAALLTPGKGDDAIVATIGPKFKAVDALAESARAKSLPTANSGIRILPEGRLPDAKFVPTEGRRQVDKILQDVKLGIEPPLENMMTDVFGDKIYVPDWMAAAMRTEKFKEAYPNGVDIFYRGFSNGVGPRWREALSGYRYGDPTKPAYFGANWDLAKNYAGGHFGPLRIGESLDVSTKGGVPNMYVMMVPKGEIEVVPPFKTVRGWNEWDKLSEPFRIEGLADRQLRSTDDIAELLQTVPKNSEFNKSGVLLQNIHDGALGNEVIWSSRRGGIPKVMHPASTFEWDLGHKWHLKDGGPVNRYDDGGFSIFKRQADNDASRNVAPKIIDRLSAITETAGNYMRALPGIAEKYLTHTGLANAVVDKIFPSEETKERQRNDAVAARILQEDAARRKSAEDELLESAYSPSYPGPEAPLKSLDWEIAALLAGLKGPMRAGKTIAKGLETFGKAMMPSTYVGEIMPAAAPYLDAAALSYYSAEAGQQAANEWRKGNYANSVAYGTMAALPAVAPLYNAVREAKPWVDFVVRGKVDPIYKAAARDIDIQRAAARVNQDLGETAGNVGAPRITFKANQRVEPISKEIDAVPLGEQSSAKVVKWMTPEGEVSVPMNTRNYGSGNKTSTLSGSVSYRVPATPSDVASNPMPNILSQLSYNIDFPVGEAGEVRIAGYRKPIKVPYVYDGSMTAPINGQKVSPDKTFPQSSGFSADPYAEFKIDSGGRIIAQAPASEAGKTAVSKGLAKVRGAIGELGDISGSSRLYENGILSGVPGDVEIVTTEENLPQLEKALNFRRGISSNPLDVSGTSPMAPGKGKVEFQVIRSTPEGKANGQIAWQMFRTMHPEEAAAQAEASIGVGNYLDRPIINPATGEAYTPAELLSEFRSSKVSTQNVINDALSTRKPYIRMGLGEEGLYKQNRPIAILTSRDAKTKAMVRRAINTIAKSQVGGEYTNGSSLFRNIDFSDVAENEKFLEKLGISKEFADDPEIMRNIFDYWYMQESVQQRGVNGASDISQARKYILTGNNDRGGGDFSGAGRNTVKGAHDPAVRSGQVGAMQTHLTFREEAINGAKNVNDVYALREGLTASSSNGISSKTVGAPRGEISNLKSSIMSMFGGKAKGSQAVNDFVDVLDKRFTESPQSIGGGTLQDLSYELKALARGMRSEGFSADDIDEVIDLVAHAFDKPYIATSGYSAGYRGVLTKGPSVGSVRQYASRQDPFEFGRDLSSYGRMDFGNGFDYNRVYGSEAEKYIPGKDQVAREEFIKFLQRLESGDMTVGDAIKGPYYTEVTDTRGDLIKPMERLYDIMLEQQANEAEVKKMLSMPGAKRAVMRDAVKKYNGAVRKSNRISLKDVHDITITEDDYGVPQIILQLEPLKGSNEYRYETIGLPPGLSKYQRWNVSPRPWDAGGLNIRKYWHEFINVPDPDVIPFAMGGPLLLNPYARGGGLSRSKDYKSSKKPYPSVKSGDFAGGGRSYPIPTKADAVDALRLAGLHHRPDVRAKVYAKYPSLKHAEGGPLDNGIDYSGIETTNNRKYNPDYISYIDGALANAQLPEAKRASILANIIEESGGDPFALDSTGKFYGLLQWANDRYSPTGEIDPYREIDNQVANIVSTLGNTTDGKSWTHGGAGSGYNSYKDAMADFDNEDLATAMKGFTLGYVRPTGKIDSYNNRLKVAQQILDKYNNVPAKKAATLIEKMKVAFGNDTEAMVRLVNAAKSSGGFR